MMTGLALGPIVLYFGNVVYGVDVGSITAFPIHSSISSTRML